jgi:hypothetical protein
MIVTRKHLPRRTFLRGAGVALALPLLDSMIPAFTALAQTAARPVRRFNIVYVPNGMVMDAWMPEAHGAGFELKPIMQPVAPFRDRLVVVSGLRNEMARADAGEAYGPHPRDLVAYATGTHPKYTEGLDVHAGVSIDQLAARQLGADTQLTSLELGLDSGEFAGACDGPFSCAYVNTMSWKTPTTPLPTEIDPRVVFQRLFGDTGTTGLEQRMRTARDNRSILDAIAGDVASIDAGLGPRDRAKLSEYLDAVRDIERRIEKSERQGAVELPPVDQPVGVPATFEEHAKLMFDLQVLAFQSDLTRVITFMVGRETSNRPYPQIGVPDAHHALSHHQNNPVKLQNLAKINTLHMQLFAYYLEKLKSTPDGDGSLLDHMLILYGSSMSDSNLHSFENLPVMLVGGASGRLKTGHRHVSLPPTTSFQSLNVTMLDALDVHVDKMGDSQGKLDGIFI